jgi:hypothetical protein
LDIEPYIFSLPTIGQTKQNKIEWDFNYNPHYHIITQPNTTMDEDEIAFSSVDKYCVFAEGLECFEEATQKQKEWNDIIKPKLLSKVHDLSAAIQLYGHIYTVVAGCYGSLITGKILSAKIPRVEDRIDTLERLMLRIISQFIDKVLLIDDEAIECLLRMGATDRALIRAHSLLKPYVALNGEDFGVVLQVLKYF